ncbi:hypothetical protein [Urbifossiella limnaea]|uniref:Uncharacterized protein n=1 Tax=Urbifossiella limnaea TaxID=2528023 RepID=A0A517Y1W2_9BACT|nr:hypothetical protein [Urbifossiella limnaea]QDU23760.1 hypothetical protein ETAA1_57670 [Urbifossiella limnaea]
MVAQRKRNDDAVVLALACGATVEAAAKQGGVSERTVYTRLRDPEFQKRIKEARTDLVRRSAGLLSAASGEAVRTLLALMKESAPPATRLGAAKAVLEVGLKIRELADLEAELRDLEEKVKALGPPDGGGRRW